MLLTIGIAGLPFSGADVGGFFGNPDTELLVRWYQAGSFQPFFRAHAHHDSKRREPWVHGEPTTTMLRNAVLARYQYLPVQPLRVFPLSAFISRAQGPSGAVATVPFVWRSHAKSPTTQAGRALDIALWLE